MPEDNNYSSESSLDDIQTDYSPTEENEYTSQEHALDDQTDTDEISYDIAKPKRIKIKARLLDD